MNENRILISVSHLKIMSAKHVLKQAGIEAISVNKMDSAHAGLFGNIQLYVAKEDAETAIKLLTDEGILD